MIAESIEKLGKLHVMIANAGIAQVKPALEVSDEDVKKMFDVNFHGVWICYTSAARQMIKQGPVRLPSLLYMRVLVSRYRMRESERNRKLTSNPRSPKAKHPTKSSAAAA